jgi:CBS domain-containing protein
MTRDFASGRPGTTRQQAQEIMQSHGVRHLPIVEDGFAVGMISMRDLLAEPVPESALQTN